MLSLDAHGFVFVVYPLSADLVSVVVVLLDCSSWKELSCAPRGRNQENQGLVLVVGDRVVVAMHQYVVVEQQSL